MNRRNLGARGENLALSYLQKQGVKLVDRNFSCPFGEIDLVVLDKKTLVFVEVKTRWSLKYGNPAEAVTRRKLQSIITTANMFRKIHPNLTDKMRVDVVAIEVGKDGSLRSLRHIKNVTG